MSPVQSTGDIITKIAKNVKGFGGDWKIFHGCQSMETIGKGELCVKGTVPVTQRPFGQRQERQATPLFHTNQGALCAATPPWHFPLPRTGKNQPPAFAGGLLSALCGFSYALIPARPDARPRRTPRPPPPPGSGPAWPPAPPARSGQGRSRRRRRTAAP